MTLSIFWCFPSSSFFLWRWLCFLKNRAIFYPVIWYSWPHVVSSIYIIGCDACTDPPSFIERPQNVESEMGENITMTCLVDSNPKADIIYVFDPIDRVSWICVFFFVCLFVSHCVSLPQAKIQMELHVPNHY